MIRSLLQPLSVQPLFCDSVSCSMICQLSDGCSQHYSTSFQGLITDLLCFFNDFQRFRDSSSDSVQ